MNPSQVPSSPWLTCAEAAVYARVHVESIRRAVRKGQLRAARVLAGRGIRIHRTWIDEWLVATATPVELTAR